MTKQKEKCKGICRNGKRCSHNAVILGYCMTHLPEITNGRKKKT